MKQYTWGGLAGCVVKRMNRATHAYMGIYHAEQADIDCGDRWATVCERHGSIVGSSSLQAAKAAASHPEWCDVCQAMLSRTP